MFWACFSGDHRRSGLIPLFGDDRGNGNQNGVNRFTIYDLYNRILPTLIQPVAGEQGIFMHDNAPTHRAYIIRELLTDLSLLVMEWPPNSPDLNPIENIWALLKCKIYEIEPRLRGHLPKKEATRLLLETAWKQLARYGYVWKPRYYNASSCKGNYWGWWLVLKRRMRSFRPPEYYVKKLGGGRSQTYEHPQYLTHGCSNYYLFAVRRHWAWQIILTWYSSLCGVTPNPAFWSTTTHTSLRVDKKERL